MKSLRNFTLAAIGLAIFVFATALTSTAPAGAQSVKVDSVKVINTAGDWAAPVPVHAQGTTNIAGNVGITGTPNVNIANMPTVGIHPSSNTVQVGNTTANPVLVRDANNPAFQPFQVSGAINLNDGVNAAAQSQPFTVGPGKRLVIEHISATGQLPSGQKFTSIQIFNVGGGYGTNHYLTATMMGSVSGGTIDQFATSQPVRLYADPGTSVFAVAYRSEAAGQGGLFFTVSGYLVNLP
jgi:hypothetical protein